MMSVLTAPSVSVVTPVRARFRSERSSKARCGPISGLGGSEAAYGSRASRMRLKGDVCAVCGVAVRVTWSRRLDTRWDFDFWLRTPSHSMHLSEGPRAFAAALGASHAQ